MSAESDLQDAVLEACSRAATDASTLLTFEDFIEQMTYQIEELQAMQWDRVSERNSMDGAHHAAALAALGIGMCCGFLKASVELRRN